MDLKKQKEAAFQHCKDFIKNQIKELQSQLEDLRNSVMLDTKSSAGDKHETGRAHLQIAQEQANRQLAEAFKLQDIAMETDINQSRNLIGTGSLVATDQGIYFLCIPAGKLVISGETIITLSIQSPLGQLFKGRNIGETISINSKNIFIKQVL